MSAYDADRYAPTSVAVLLQLPPSNARAFAVASALGRFLDKAGTSDRLRSGRQAAGSLVDQHRLPAVLEALNLKGRRWRQLVEDWEGRYLAHRCGPVRVFLFARPLPETCAGCGTEIVYDHVPASPRPNRGPGFAANGSTTAAETAVPLPEVGTGTAAALAQVLPPTRTDAPHLEKGFYGMEVGVAAPTTEQGEIGLGVQGVQEGALKKRAAPCEACSHAHWTLGACREPSCGCEVTHDA